MQYGDSSTVATASLFNVLETASGLPEIFWPGQGEIPNGNHLLVSDIPAPTINPTLNADSYKLVNGILQVTVYVQQGKNAEFTAKGIAQQVLALYPMGSKLTGVQIDTVGSILPVPVVVDGYHAKVVSIPYRIIV